MNYAQNMRIYGAHDDAAYWYDLVYETINEKLKTGDDFMGVLLGLCDVVGGVFGSFMTQEKGSGVEFNIAAIDSNKAVEAMLVPLISAALDRYRND